MDCSQEEEEKQKRKIKDMVGTWGKIQVESEVLNGHSPGPFYIHCPYQRRGKCNYSTVLIARA